MQSQLNAETTNTSRRNGSQSDVRSFDGEYIAKVFKYYRKLQNPRVNHTFPMKLVSGKVLYKKHKVLFDNFAKVASKNSFDVESYLKYCIRCGIQEDNIEACLASMTMINKYALHVKVVNKRKKIYKWFLKSATNIAKECVENGYSSSKDYIIDLLKSGKAAGYVSAGVISLYYFAAIPKFDIVISKLDIFTKQAMTLLLEHFDIYHSEVNKAFMLMKNVKVNPIKFTDTMIAKMWK